MSGDRHMLERREKILSVKQTHKNLSDRMTNSEEQMVKRDLKDR